MDPASFAREFEPDEGRVWLNTAHQGKLPRRAAEALQEAVGWKLRPRELTTADRFTEVPRRLRAGLARAIGAEPEDVVLANSASYGLHLIANGLDLGRGDEVVVAANDFPSDILPWIPLRERGVRVRMIEPDGEVLTPEELAAALTERTKAVCLTWVHSFSGRVLDVEAVGSLCRDAGVWFVLNGAQAVGIRPIDVMKAPVDALTSVGFKWLCGPYGTGLCWLRRELHDSLTPTKLYWLSALTSEDLAAPTIDVASVEPRRAGRYDVFGTANFFNFVPFTAAVELMLEIGIDEAARYVDTLVERLVTGIDRERYRLVSAEAPGERSSLVTVEPLKEPAERVLERLREAGVYCAHRRGRVRVSPHVYNSPDDIDRALAAF
jgi:selenocysteine lyase/cysteine desulfurase